MSDFTSQAWTKLTRQRTAAWFFAACLAVLAGCATPPPAGQGQDSVAAPWQRVVPGLDYRRFSPWPDSRVHVLRLDLREPGLRLEVSAAAERGLLCADVDGFSLHAAVRCGADDRQGLEQLCRYITRPALANERVQTNAAGQVVLKLKTAWRDGTTHLVLSPLEFMQRLAALVPRPRLHLIRFGVRVTSLREVSGPPLREHGVLAPNAKLRALVVPQEPELPAQVSVPAECEAACAHHLPVRLSWAQLLKRVFEIDMEHCPNCGGELKIIAAILWGEPGRRRS